MATELIKQLLEKGYHVRTTVRGKEPAKVAALTALSKALPGEAGTPAARCAALEQLLDVCCGISCPAPWRTSRLPLFSPGPRRVPSRVKRGCVRTGCSSAAVRFWDQVSHGPATRP